jgi:hypothetical protein
VSAGVMHACGLRRADRKAVCWGRDLDGMVSGAPADVEFSDVSTGTWESCGVRASDGQVVCWGLGGYDGSPETF